MWRKYAGKSKNFIDNKMAWQCIQGSTRNVSPIKTNGFVDITLFSLVPINGQYTFDQCKQLQILQLSTFSFHFAYWLPILTDSFQVGGLTFSGLNPKCMKSSFPIAVWCWFGFSYRYRFQLLKKFKGYTFTLIYLPLSADLVTEFFIWFTLI